MAKTVARDGPWSCRVKLITSRVYIPVLRECNGPWLQDKKAMGASALWSWWLCNRQEWHVNTMQQMWNNFTLENYYKISELASNILHKLNGQSLKLMFPVFTAISKSHCCAQCLHPLSVSVALISTKWWDLMPAIWIIVYEWDIKCNTVPSLYQEDDR